MAIIAVAAITLAGLGLRLYGIDHGLPHQYIPDESTMVGGALRMGAAKTIQPPTFIYPALLMYLFAAEFLGLLVAGWAIGLFTSIAQFREYAFADPTLFYLLPRLTIALLGTATIPLVYLLGRRLYGSWAGVVAAALIATSLMHVQMSHQARHWVPVTLLALAVLWVSLDLSERGRSRDYCTAGLLVGLAAAASYNGFLLLILPVVAHWMHLRKTRVRSPGDLRHEGTERARSAQREDLQVLRARVVPGQLPRAAALRAHLPIALTALLAFALFFALNPFILLQADRFLAFHSSGEASIGGQIRGHYEDYLGQFLAKQGFTFYAWAALSYDPAISLLGAIGTLTALRRFRSTLPLVLAYPLFHYLMFATTAPSMEQRYMLPALAIWALPAGLAGASLLEQVRGRLGAPRAEVAAALLGILLAALVSIPSVRYDSLLSQMDTRTLAKEWIESNIPAGADVAVESYPPPLTADPETLRAQQQAEPRSLGARDQWLLERGLPPGEVAYRLTRLNLVDTSPRVDRLTPYLASHQHRYFVVSDFRWKSDHLGHQALKGYLARNGRLIQLFSPAGEADYVPSDLLNNMEDPLVELTRVERPGPRIEIYEVPQ